MGYFEIILLGYMVNVIALAVTIFLGFVTAFYFYYYDSLNFAKLDLELKMKNHRLKELREQLKDKIKEGKLKKLPKYKHKKIIGLLFPFGGILYFIFTINGISSLGYYAAVTHTIDEDIEYLENILKD